MVIIVSELKENLDRLRKNLDVKATENRDLRDEWNGKTREHLGTRNTFNSQVRELISEVQSQKAIRDEANAAVKEAKAVRSEKNDAVKAAKKTLRSLSGEADGNEQRSGGRDWKKRDKKETPASLRRKFERLERELEIGKHTGNNEAKLMAQLKNIQSEMRKMVDKEDSNVELKDARDSLRVAIEAQESAHQAVTVAAETAQDAHDLMLKISEEVDRLREQADSAQSLVRRAKREADGAHQSYIVSLRCLHSIQDILRAQQHRESGVQEKEADSTARVGVQDLMERLMDGDELSVDDLMALQRGG